MDVIERQPLMWEIADSSILSVVRHVSVYFQTAKWVFLLNLSYVILSGSITRSAHYNIWTTCHANIGTPKPVSEFMFQGLIQTTTSVMLTTPWARVISTTGQDLNYATSEAWLKYSHVQQLID